MSNKKIDEKLSSPINLINKQNYNKGSNEVEMKVHMLKITQFIFFFLAMKISLIIQSIGHNAVVCRSINHIENMDEKLPFIKHIINDLLSIFVVTKYSRK